MIYSQSTNQGYQITYYSSRVVSKSGITSYHNRGLNTQQVHDWPISYSKDPFFKIVHSITDNFLTPLTDGILDLMMIVSLYLCPIDSSSLVQLNACPNIRWNPCSHVWWKPAKISNGIWLSCESLHIFPTQPGCKNPILCLKVVFYFIF